MTMEKSTKLRLIHYCDLVWLDAQFDHSLWQNKRRIEVNGYIKCGICVN